MVIKYDQHQSKPEVAKVFAGRLVHSKSLKKLEITRHAAIGVKYDGTIVFVHKHKDEESLHRRIDSIDDAEVVKLKPSQFLFPGMIDTHLHAPQWPNLALGMEGNLREWVEEWTDPIEVCQSHTWNGQW